MTNQLTMNQNYETKKLELTKIKERNNIMKIQEKEKNLLQSNNQTFDITRYIVTKKNVPIYKDKSLTNPFGRFHEGAKFVPHSIEGNRIRIYFGTKEGKQKPAYIRQKDCTVGEKLEKNIDERVVTIAKSLVGLYGSTLGLDGNYCENFIHWLIGASGLECDYEVYTASGYCGPAVAYYKNRLVYSILDPNELVWYCPGSLVYYGVKNYETGKIIAEHVGLIVSEQVDSGDFISIEGNAGDKKGKNGQYKIAQKKREFITKA